MQLEFLHDEYSIYRLPPKFDSDAANAQDRSLAFEIMTRLERETRANEFYSLSRTPDEVSIILPSRLDAGLRQTVQCGPSEQVLKAQSGFRCFRVNESMAFDVIGVISAISRVLADSDIPLLSISTFDTDYFLIGKGHVSTCRAKLSASGYSFQSESESKTCADD